MARRHLLLVEKGVATDALHHGVLSQVVQEKLLADIDGRLLHLESAGPDDGSAEQEQSPDGTDERNATE
jgi:hypothetical protein